MKPLTTGATGNTMMEKTLLGTLLGVTVELSN